MIRSKAGMTIIEMMIAIAIFGIGIAAFSALFVNTWKSNKFTLEMGQTTTLVSQGMNKIIGYVRSARQGDNGAYALVSANDNDLVLYNDYDKDSVTERLHIYKSGTDVMMGITRPTNTMPKTYPAGDEQTIKLASSIMNNSSTPIFYYFNKNYTGTNLTVPMTTPAVVSQVGIVRILLKINIDPNNAPNNIEMESFARFRN